MFVLCPAQVDHFAISTSQEVIAKYNFLIRKLFKQATNMSEVETYPTLEFLHKVAQKAVLLEEKRHSGTFVKVGVPNVSIKSMMTDETFILPMEPEQPGSELYCRVVCKFGITPAILRKLHVE